MKNPKVNKVNLGRPPEGTRTIVFVDGHNKERSLLVHAEKDWEIGIAIDTEKDPHEIFCVAFNPEGSELRVTKMSSGQTPKHMSLAGPAIASSVGNLSEKSTNEIVESVRGSL
jgi:hypothetical protein